MAEKRDGFFKSADKFFKRLSNQDVIRTGDKGITQVNTARTAEEQNKRRELSVFRQYLQAKNWSTKHLEQFAEYRKMDETYPLINAALKIYQEEVCLTGDTIIRTPMGDLSILDLIERGKDKDMFYVQSVYDRRTDWAIASCIKHNGKKKVFEVTIERNIDEDNLEWDTIEIPKFKCTDNHKIMMPDKSFKMLSELKEGDEIFSFYKYKDPDCNCLENVFQKSKILEIKELPEEDVYDLVNVSPNSHFSIKLTDSLFVEVHNCTKDDDGNIVKIISDNIKVKESLEECFFKNLKINSQGYLLVKEMLKFGNLYCFQNVRKGEGVLDLIPLPPEAIKLEIQNNSDNLDDYKFIWNGTGGGMKFEPWEMIHFRNVEDLDSMPYGTSILRSIVDTWRRIILLRESLIIYRVTRAPQRFLFNIDTTGMDPQAALLYAEEFRKQLKKKPLQNPQTGEIDWKFSPLSITEDFFMPRVEGDVSGIQVLEGATNMDQLEDYKIILDDLFIGLMIPKAFLTAESDLSNKAALCIKGDTRISTNFGIKTVEELAENWNPREKVYVLSCNKHGFIVQGKVKWCKQTDVRNELYKIGVNNSFFEETTDHHPFMLETLEYRRADELQIGDRLKGIYHKDYIVTSIEIIQYEEEPVYDLEVEEFHNFALASEIFIKNSNEDVKFASTVKRYQSHFVEGLLQIALTHLHLQGFSKDDLSSFTLEMNINSKLLKKLQNETLQQQVDLAKSILDISNGELTLMSLTQVLRDIMKFTDAQIQESFENQFVEKKMSWRLQNLKDNGFFEEPEQNKKQELADKLSDNDDIFSKLKFENKETASIVKNILTENVNKEIQMLAKKIVAKPGFKDIRRVIQINETSVFKTMRDLE